MIFAINRGKKEIYENIPGINFLWNITIKANQRNRYVMLAEDMITLSCLSLILYSCNNVVISGNEIFC
jgi:hypothetical protein